jgi:hypothetical protein
MRVSILAAGLALGVAVVLLVGGLRLTEALGFKSNLLPQFDLQREDWWFEEGEGQAGVRPIFETGSSRGVSVAYSWLPVGLTAADYPSVVLKFNQRERYPTLLWGWQGAGGDGRLNTQPIAPDADGNVLIDLSQISTWSGEVAMVAIIAQGDVDGLTLENATAVPAEVIPWHWSKKGLTQWFHPPPWVQRSPNANEVALGPVILPPVVVILPLGLFAAGLVLIWQRRRSKWRWEPYLCLLAISWIALDARWQFDLFSKHVQTARVFAGKSWEEKQLAMPGGELYAFMLRLRPLIDDKTSRIFALSTSEFLADRAVYHSVPNPAIPVKTPLDAARLATYAKPGDVVILADERIMRASRLRAQRNDVENLYWEFPVAQVRHAADIVTLEGRDWLVKHKGERVPLLLGQHDGISAGYYSLSVDVGDASEDAWMELRVGFRPAKGEPYLLARRRVDAHDIVGSRLTLKYAVPDEPGVVRYVVVAEDGMPVLRLGGLQIYALPDQHALTHLEAVGERSQSLIVRPMFADRSYVAWEIL